MTRPRKIRFPLLLFCYFLVVVHPVATSSAESQDQEVAAALEAFSRVYQVAEANYADPLDPDAAILDGAIRGLLSHLDPFSAFFDPEQFRQLRDQQQGRSRGFGSILYVQSGKLLVLQTLEGSPSWRAGLGPGDEIVKINDKRVDSLPLPDLVQLLRQARTSRAQLSVVRPGKILPEEFILDPAEINPPSVDKAFLLSPGVAYLHLKRFDQRTPQEVAQSLRDLGDSSMKGLILDLRGNRGGGLDSGVRVAGLFLPGGETVVTMRGRSIPEKEFSTPVPNPYYTFPLVVMTNGETASAAEIVAGALQDQDRAVVVGESSFGKATVQSVLPLSEGMGIALTTAAYFTPSGRSIQRPLKSSSGELLDFSMANGGADDLSFRSLGGRPLAGGGGIIPDLEDQGWQLAPWTRFLERNTVFVNFAQFYLTIQGSVNEEFEVTDAAMEQFNDYLRNVGIRVPADAWESDQQYLRMRIKNELFNLVFGLEKGDEVEVRNDPQVLKAQEVLPRVEEILRPSS
ncbi:MAG: S41 family peptidase [Acidobacteriota bacterium]